MHPSFFVNESEKKYWREGKGEGKNRGSLNRQLACQLSLKNCAHLFSELFYSKPRSQKVFRSSQSFPVYLKEVPAISDKRTFKIKRLVPIDKHSNTGSTKSSEIFYFDYHITSNNSRGNYQFCTFFLRELLEVLKIYFLILSTSINQFIFKYFFIIEAFPDFLFSFI